MKTQVPKKPLTSYIAEQLPSILLFDSQNYFKFCGKILSIDLILETLIGDDFLNNNKKRGAAIGSLDGPFFLLTQILWLWLNFNGSILTALLCIRIVYLCVNLLMFMAQQLMKY